MNETFKLNGRFEVCLRDQSNGRVKEGRVVHNLIPFAGKAGAASRLNGAGGEAAFTWIALGTGVVAPATGDTTLGTEIVASGLARANSTVSRVTTTVANDTMQNTFTWTASGSVAITEAGILNAAAVGTLLSRQTFSVVNVVSGDGFTITYKIQCS